jgi:hypothetical protein
MKIQCLSMLTLTCGADFWFDILKLIIFNRFWSFLEHPNIKVPHTFFNQSNFFLFFLFFTCLKADFWSEQLWFDDDNFKNTFGNFESQILKSFPS